jgi:hypothetical protein
MRLRAVTPDGPRDDDAILAPRGFALSSCKFRKERYVSVAISFRRYESVLRSAAIRSAILFARAFVSIDACKVDEHACSSMKREKLRAVGRRVTYLPRSYFKHTHRHSIAISSGR